MIPSRLLRARAGIVLSFVAGLATLASAQQPGRARTLPGTVSRLHGGDPLTYVSPDDPPFLIIRGNKDMVVPYNQSEPLSAALKKAKAECYFITVDGAGHGGLRNPGVQRREQQFFDLHPGNGKATISENTIPNQTLVRSVATGPNERVCPSGGTHDGW